MKKVRLLLALTLACLLLYMTACRSDKTINATGEEYFDEKGFSTDSTLSFLTEKYPNSIKCYVEVSGSMNGFLRANKATQFKEDVWSILSDFNPLINNIYTFSSQCVAMPLDAFRTKMNEGAFVSAASTHIPDMLQQIIKDLDWENGESAILISDMKYSPTGIQSMPILLEQYKTDIRNLIGESGISLSLLAATSNYLNKAGQEICANSPYYYLILGKAENIVWLRNCIATLLNERYAGSIECGIDYQTPSFSLDNKPYNLSRLENAPTYTDFDREYSDTCAFTVALNLEAYPWGICNPDIIKELVQVRMKNGSEIKIDTIVCHEDNHFNNELKRIAIAAIRLKVYDMYEDCDVAELTFTLPDNQMLVNRITPPQFRSFWGATSENEYDKSFSIENFIQGCFRGSKNLGSKQPIRILISTINQ